MRAKQFLNERTVDNPMLTDGLAYSGQRNVHYRIKVTENAITRIGALCYIKRREPYHEQAAERFKSGYEALFGSGTPALDNSRPVVDTSPQAHDSGMAAKIDRGYDMRALVWGFGPDRPAILSKKHIDRLVAALVLCIPPGQGLSSRPRQRAVDELLEAMDSLSNYWGLRSRAA
jgi:hypothetical protein